MILGRTGSHSAFGIAASLILVASLSVLSSLSWGACTTSGGVEYSLNYGSGSCGVGYGNVCSSSPPWDCSEVVTDGTFYYTNSYRGSYMCDAGSYMCGYQKLCNYRTKCGTETEADSAYCALNPLADACVEEDVPASCEDDYNTCIGVGGQWKKISSTNTECASTCNTCGSADVSFRNRAADICCQQGKAPPDSAVQCSMPVNSGTGMTWSTRWTASHDEAYSCGDLSTADGEGIAENIALYKRFCEDGDRYEEQPPCIEGVDCDSLAALSSSSQEQPNSSFSTDLDALGALYGVLDTIRDTLTKRLTPATEQILTCLQSPGLCPALQQGGDTVIVNVNGDSSILKVDTTLRKLIAPLIDSSLKIDSAQFKTLKSLDSLYRRGLVNDSDIVTAVRAVRGEIENMDSSVVRAVRGVKDGVDSLIDSMTKYLNRSNEIADSIAGIAAGGFGALGDSIGYLRGDLEGYMTAGSLDGDTGSNVYDGVGVDTGGYGWLSDIDRHLGQSMSDSAFAGVFPADSSMIDSSMTDTSYFVPNEDSLYAVLRDDVDSTRAALADTFESAFDTLSKEYLIINFDSLILEPLGVRVPNSNTCPEQCFSFTIEGNNSQGQNWLGDVGTLDFGLCRPLPGLNINVFLLLRLIARILVAVSCIYIALWFIGGRKI